MSKNKAQHYVSSFYLYHFTNEQQKQKQRLLNSTKRKTIIWHYDKKKGEIKNRPIEKVATESYLFSFQNYDGSYNHSLDEDLNKYEIAADKAFIEIDNIVNSFKKGGTRAVRLNKGLCAHSLEKSTVAL